MFLSVFDIFKIGVGPSSSHTMGPMVAGGRFLDALRQQPFRAHGLRASLHGSLAFTGKGHATDRAVVLGLLGFLPETIDPDRAEAERAKANEHRRFVHTAQVSELATEMKAYAKSFSGSIYVVDRRSDPELDG